MKTIDDFFTKYKEEIIKLNNYNYNYNSAETQFEMLGFLPSFFSDNSNNKELITKVINFISFSLTFINFEKNESVLFKTYLNAYFDSFLYKENRFLIYNNDDFYIAKYKEFFDKNSHFLTKELFEELILKYTEHKSERHVLDLVLKCKKNFFEKYEDKNNYIDFIHLNFKNNNLKIPFELIDFCEYLVDETFYKNNKTEILEQKIKYSSKEENNYTLHLYSKYMTKEEIIQYAYHVDKIYYLDYIKQFSDILDSDTLIDIFILFFKKKKHNRYKFLEQIDKSLLDLVSERLIEYNPKNYLFLSSKKQIELIEKIDFEKNKVLLNKHPKKETISRQSWLKAFEKGFIKLENIPDFLINGKERLSIDEWNVVFKNISSVKNKNLKKFLNIFNDEKYKNEVVESIYHIEDSKVNRLEIVITANRMKVIKDHRDKVISQCILSAQSNDENKLAETLFNFMKERFFNNAKELEEILKEFKK